MQAEAGPQGRVPPHLFLGQSTTLFSLVNDSLERGKEKEREGKSG